MTKLNSGWTNI